MKIGYARVSTHEQLHDLQIDSLKAAGCERIYTDTCSGSVPGAERPELQTALAHARTGDTLVVWRLDRLGRSLQDLIRQINGLAEREVQFISLQEDLNTATPAGRLTFHFCGALAEFERDLIRERTLASLTAARARGRKGGRKRKVDDRMLAHAAELMQDRTVGINEICRIVGVGKTTLYRYLTPDGQRRGERLPDVAR